MKTDRHIDIMGIVNLTDDSYFAESRCGDVESALQRIGQMVSDGADIIDIGACSSRPGSVPVGPEREWERLEPVLKAVRASFPDVRISIDTYWASVVEKAYSLIGDFIVNDISAGEDDPLMLPTVGRLGLEYVAMHKRGTPQTMMHLTEYEEVVTDVVAALQERVERMQEAGVASSQIILDPGFGFAKTLQQEYELLAGLDRLVALGYPVLVGVSRKSMITKTLDITPEEALNGTSVLNTVALMKGAHILRVHDVKPAAEAVKLVAQMKMNPNSYK